MPRPRAFRPTSAALEPRQLAASALLAAAEVAAPARRLAVRAGYDGLYIADNSLYAVTIRVQGAAGAPFGQKVLVNANSSAYFYTPGFQGHHRAFRVEYQAQVTKTFDQSFDAAEKSTRFAPPVPAPTNQNYQGLFVGYSITTSNGRYRLS